MAYDIRKVDQVAENLAPVVALHPDQENPVVRNAEDAMFDRNAMKRAGTVSEKSEKQFLETVEALVSDMDDKQMSSSNSWDRLSKSLDTAMDRNLPASNVIQMKPAARAAAMAAQRSMGF